VGKREMNFRQTLVRKIYNIFEDEIINNLQAGGHCGFCGKWVPYDILPRYWAITLCDKCSKGDFSHIKSVSPKESETK
jgi:hypothetical protein